MGCTVGFPFYPPPIWGFAPHRFETLTFDPHTLETLTFDLPPLETLTFERLLETMRWEVESGSFKEEVETRLTKKELPHLANFGLMHVRRNGPKGQLCDSVECIRGNGSNPPWGSSTSTSFTLFFEKEVQT